LAARLQLEPGDTVADIGAGSGALIVELARHVGPQGAAYATERTPDQRQRIAARAASAPVPVTVVEAGDQTTNLPDACCDAIAMRMVMHHIADPAAFARDLRRSVRSGGRVAIIDFAPGALPHLTDDHGIEAGRLVEAFHSAGFTATARSDGWGGRTFLLVFTAS
jgi:ubiquinone/menaquinone biosynthesis C-methylase UbiE